MADRTLAENVAQVKADFKSVREAVNYAIPKGTPTSEYGERIHNEISNLMSQADSNYNYGLEVGIEQGIEQGKQEVISNSKFIEKSVSGTVIRSDDVSEVAHKVVVKADEPTEVKVYGKNLFNNDTSLLKEVTYMGTTQQSTRIGYEPLVLPSGTYTFTLKDLGTDTDKYIYGVINDKDGNYVTPCHLFAGTDNKTPLTITVNEGDKIYIYDGFTSLNVSASAKRFNSVEIQLEVGVGTNEYEPYKSQTITATPSGTKVASICPIMTFISDNDVTVDYYGSYGMQTEYDRFWDSFQQNGTRASYSHAFYGAGWNEATFRPKYDIVPSTLVQCFYSSPLTNLTSILEKQGVVLDTSNCTNLSFAFAHTKITNIPKINMSACTNSTSAFVTSTSLVRIEGIVSSEKTVFDKSTFQNNTALEHCIFEGTIASDINLQWSTKLSRESILSLLQCLNATVSGVTVTLPTKCTNKATDTLALIQGDTELNTAYTQALANGYTITFA